MRSRKAFSLVELLVVIAIIAMLVSILLPTLNKAKELARRATCGANLSSIGKAANLYAVENNQYYPVDYTTKTGAALVTVGDQANKDVDTGAQSRAWFTLVRAGLTMKGFVCASDTAAVQGEGSPSKLWDFPVTDKGWPISYSFQRCIYKKGDATPIWLARMDSNAQVALAADTNGLMKWTRTGNYWKGERDNNVPLSNATTAARRKMNSPNHQRAGQNMLRTDGSISWKDTVFCGADGDNVYTYQTKKGDPDQLGGFDANAPPDSEMDSFLLP